MRYTFVVDQREVSEAQLNTKEPFKNLFITRLPSECEEVGYERVNDTLVIKYEENEDGRILINSQLPYEISDRLPRIFGIILKLHYGVTKIKVGNKIYHGEVIVNSPNGVYYTELMVDGKVLRHEVNGTVFTYANGVYSAVSDETINTLHERFISRGTGTFIPDTYLVRFVINGSYTYSPLARLFHGALVASSFTPDVPAEDWLKKGEELDEKLGREVS